MGINTFRIVHPGVAGCKGRVLALDYGLKRCGLAVTDPLQLVAGPLGAVPARDILTFLTGYFRREKVCGMVVGYSAHKDGTPVEHEKHISLLLQSLRVLKPDLALYRLDEKYTSRMAQRVLTEVGAPKKERMKKENVDVVSAVIMLQEYLHYYKQL